MDEALSYRLDSWRAASPRESTAASLSAPRLPDRPCSPRASPGCSAAASGAASPGCSRFRRTSCSRAAGQRRGAGARVPRGAVDVDRRARAARRRGGVVGALPAHAGLPAARCASCRTRPPSCSAAGAADVLAGLREEPAVAIVGTRRPSPYGSEVAYALGRGLGAAGVPVVSGLALGIDATAHRGCLDGGGMPVAVLACGPDVVYPRRHRRLHERVRERGPGAVGAAARHRAVPVELPGAQPDHGRAGADDAGGRGGRPERQPDHAPTSRRTWVAAWRPCPGRVTSSVARGHQQAAEATAPSPITRHRGRARRAVRRRRAAGAPRRARRRTGRSGAACRPRRRRQPRLGGGDRRGDRPLIRETRAALGRLEADGYLVRRDLGGWERTAR